MHTHRNPPTQGRDASPSRPQHKVATPPSTPCLPLRRRGRDAFTLIEVLVASAILIVIVLIISMVFQQGAVAWSSGIARTDSIMQARSLIGAATYELRSSAFVTNQNAYVVITETEAKEPSLDGLIQAAADAIGIPDNKVNDFVTPTVFGAVSGNDGIHSAVQMKVVLNRTNTVSEIIGSAFGTALDNENPVVEVR